MKREIAYIVLCFVTWFIANIVGLAVSFLNEFNIKDDKLMSELISQDKKLTIWNYVKLKVYLFVGKNACSYVILIYIILIMHLCIGGLLVTFGIMLWSFAQIVMDLINTFSKCFAKATVVASIMPAKELLISENVAIAYARINGSNTEGLEV
jgi:hypothetical protein